MKRVNCGGLFRVTFLVPESHFFMLTMFAGEQSGWTYCGIIILCFQMFTWSRQFWGIERSGANGVSSRGAMARFMVKPVPPPPPTPQPAFSFHALSDGSKLGMGLTHRPDSKLAVPALQQESWWSPINKSASQFTNQNKVDFV